MNRITGILLLTRHLDRGSFFGFRSLLINSNRCYYPVLVLHNFSTTSFIFLPIENIDKTLENCVICNETSSSSPATYLPTVLITVHRLKREQTRQRQHHCLGQCDSSRIRCKSEVYHKFDDIAHIFVSIVESPKK